MIKLTKSTDTKYDAKYKGHRVVVIKLISHWGVSISKGKKLTYINMDFNTMTEAVDFLNKYVDVIYNSNNIVLEGVTTNIS